MQIRKYTKHAVFVAGLLSMAAIFSRCAANSSGSGKPATSFAISGNVSTGLTAASISSMSVDPNAEAVIMAGDVNALATQCSDGFFYSVYCVSYSEPPVAATGAVSCGGASSGSFTVAGLPLNAEIGCFVRRSANNTTFTTLGTIEIPTTSLSGGTTTLVSQGDLNLSINLNTNGSITTTVTGGGTNVVTPVASGTNIDPAQYNGFWSVSCDATGSAEFNPVKCKCQNGGQSLAAYQTGGVKNPTVVSGAQQPNPEDACKTDNAAEVTNPAVQTQQFVEINMYKASPASSLTIENGVVIPAGTQIPVISVWSASSSTVSARGGAGEGANTVVKDKFNANVTLTWTPSSQVTAPLKLANASSGSVSMGNGVTTNFAAVSAMPSLSSSTHAQWVAYIQSLYSNSTGFTCTWGTGGVNDSGCLSQFVNKVIREHLPVNLPTIQMDRACDNSGCQTNPAFSFIRIDGMRVNYGAATGTTDNSAVTFTLESVTPELKNRYVFEPFEASPTGGGFTQHHFHNENFGCSVSGAGVRNAACTGGTQNWVNCGVREEEAIHFKPTDATHMKLFFDSRSTVAYATLEKWTAGTKTMGSFADAMAICNSQVTSREGRFQMNAVHQ